MAPIKFEDNIREKLQERELQPSAKAWEKLSGRLGEPKKKERSITLWYAVAASIAALLVIGSLVFSPSERASEALVLEDNPSEEVNENNSPELVEMPTVTEELAVENTPSEEKEKANTKTETKVIQNKRDLMVTQNNSQKEDKTKLIAENDTPQKKEASLNEAIQFSEATYINSKVDEVLAKVNAMQQENASITPEDIDALLAEAQREIKTQQILNRNTNKVDAAALLMDVETELDRSFRDKVFDALGESFQKIRTAVIERNN